MIGIILWALAAALGLAFRAYAAPDFNTKPARVTISVVLGVVAFVANLVMRLTVFPVPPRTPTTLIPALVAGIIFYYTARRPRQE